MNDELKKQTQSNPIYHGVASGEAGICHGCFWHMHRCKYGRVIPKTNKKFWENKRNGNVQRSSKNIRALRRIGWKVLVVWECWARDVTKLEKWLRDFLKA